MPDFPACAFINFSRRNERDHPYLLIHLTHKKAKLNNASPTNYYNFIQMFINNNTRFFK